MRLSALTTLIIPAVAAGRLFKDDAYLDHSGSASTTASASPASMPSSRCPAATSTSVLESLELRQAPGLAPANAAPPPPAANPVNPALPALTTTSALLASPGVNQDFVTVQWIETWIGGTSQTWIPKTIIFHFKPYMTQAPLPGKGEIGMGTLTGKTGKTQTVLMAAAPTQAAGWMRGVAAALGVGVVGIVV